MACTYAAILGLLAFCTVTIRGLLNVGSFDTTLQRASCCSLVFAAIGYCVAALAALVVEETLRATSGNNPGKPTESQWKDAGPVQRQ